MVKSTSDGSCRSAVLRLRRGVRQALTWCERCRTVLNCESRPRSVILDVDLKYLPGAFWLPAAGVLISSIPKIGTDLTAR